MTKKNVEYGKAFRIAKEDHEKLDRLSKSRKLKKKDIIGYFLDINEKVDLLHPEWQNHLQALREKAQVVKDSKMEGQCLALTLLTKGYHCCKNAPKQHRLGNGEYDDMSQICGACKRLKGIIDELDLFRKRAKHGTIMRLPQCAHGGKINDKGDKLYCQFRGEWKSPENWCQVINPRTMKRGSPCPYLKWSKIKVEGEFNGEHGKNF